MVPLVVALGILSATSGCGALGLYQSAGHLPGIAITDYAFYFFCGTASQLYPFAPAQTGSAMMEALGDLGFQVSDPPAPQADGAFLIRARTPDGRHTRITMTPQNAMTNLRVVIGPGHIGDYELSRDLLRRVALNLGTGIRAYTPTEPTLARRINVPRDVPPQVGPTPPEELQGEGLRPIPGQATTPYEEQTVPGSVVPPIVPQMLGLPGAFQQFVTTRDFPNPPNMPYAPFPYTPFNQDLYQ
jgi:hypothetical protein